MLWSVILSLLTAVGIVVALLLYEYLTGTSVEQQEAAYWKRHEPLNCPLCNTAYASDALSGSYSGSKAGRTFRCGACGEIAGFNREDSAPTYSFIKSQSRCCQECGENFMGEPESRCPICNSNKHCLGRNEAIFKDSSR